MEEREKELELTEAQIAVHWKEEEYYYLSQKFIEQANASDPPSAEAGWPRATRPQWISRPTGNSPHSCRQPQGVAIVVY